MRFLFNIPNPNEGRKEDELYGPNFLKRYEEGAFNAPVGNIIEGLKSHKYLLGPPMPEYEENGHTKRDSDVLQSEDKLLGLYELQRQSAFADMINAMIRGVHDGHETLPRASMKIAHLVNVWCIHMQLTPVLHRSYKDITFMKRVSSVVIRKESNHINFVSAHGTIVPIHNLSFKIPAIQKAEEDEFNNDTPNGSDTEGTSGPDRTESEISGEE